MDGRRQHHGQVVQYVGREEGLHTYIHAYIHGEKGSSGSRTLTYLSVLVVACGEIHHRLAALLQTYIQTDTYTHSENESAMARWATFTFTTDNSSTRLARVRVRVAEEEEEEEEEGGPAAVDPSPAESEARPLCPLAADTDRDPARPPGGFIGSG